MHPVEQVGSAIVIHVRANLDVVSAPALATRISLAEANDQGRIVVSLEDCTFCDAVGLSVLVRARQRNGSAFFVVLPEAAPLRRNFAVTGLATLLHPVSTMESALNSELGAA